VAFEGCGTSSSSVASAAICWLYEMQLDESKEKSHLLGNRSIHREIL
jgi:hypothetical protein